MYSGDSFCGSLFLCVKTVTEMAGVIDFRCKHCGRLLAKTDGNTEIKCPRCGAINRYSASDNTIECEPKEKSDQRSTSSGMTFR